MFSGGSKRNIGKKKVNDRGDFGHHWKKKIKKKCEIDLPQISEIETENLSGKKFNHAA